MGENAKSGERCANLPEVLVHATAGKDLYRRRGGLRYVLAERGISEISGTARVEITATGTTRWLCPVECLHRADFPSQAVLRNGASSATSYAPLISARSGEKRSIGSYADLPS